LVPFFSSFGRVDTRFLIVFLEDFARDSLIFCNDDRQGAKG